MKTRVLIGLGFGLAPALLQCGETAKRQPVEGQSGNSAGADATGQAGSHGGSLTGQAAATNGGNAPSAGNAAGGIAQGGAIMQAGNGGATLAEDGGAGGSAPDGEVEVACPANVLGHCSEGVTYPPHAGFTLALVEDFPAPLDLNADPIWTWSDGSPADSQTELEEDNIGFAGGRMRITADQNSGTGCAPKTTNAACIDDRTSFAEAVDPNTTATIGKMGVASGELRTKYNNYRYGYYEVKVTAPIANPGKQNTDNMSGGFMSVMSAFRAPRSARWNEINITLSPDHHDGFGVEVVTARGAADFPGGNAHPFLASPASFLVYQEHVYAFSWMPDKIEWFCDGLSVHSFTGSVADPITTLSAKVLLRLSVFSGTAFGDPKDNKYPFQSSYDYFHFYKADTETTYPCSPTPACLAPADKTKSAQNNPKEVDYGL